MEFHLTPTPRPHHGLRFEFLEIRHLTNPLPSRLSLNTTSSSPSTATYSQHLRPCCAIWFAVWLFTFRLIPRSPAFSASTQPCTISTVRMSGADPTHFILFHNAGTTNLFLVGMAAFSLDRFSWLFCISHLKDLREKFSFISTMFSLILFDLQYCFGN